MKKICVFTILIMLLTVTSNYALSANIETENTIEILETDLIFVDKNNTIGPWDGTYDNPYKNITSGVDNAKKDDIIYVLNGIYNEQITIEKPIRIIGEDKTKTIIDPEYQEYGIKIKENNVIIEKFTIRNAGGYEGNAGIIIESDKNQISDCIIKRTRTGILLKNTDQNTIENCTLYLNGEGIYTKSNENLTVKTSEFCYSSIGINSRDTKNSLIKDTYVHETGAGLFFNISSNIEVIDSAICDNNDNGGGCGIYNSNNFKFKNCNILHNGFGMRLQNSKSIKIEKCDIENVTHFGLWVQKNSEIEIFESNLINNFRHCIYMSDSYCKVEQSNLYNNKIESVNVEDSLCIAKDNYWGGKLGPIFNYGFRIPDIFKLHFRKIKFIPWSIEKYNAAGSNWEVKNKFSKTIVHGYEDEPIDIPGIDTDNDGAPDWWEEEFNYNITKYDDHQNLDPDGDALNNIEDFEKPLL